MRQRPPTRPGPHNDHVITLSHNFTVVAGRARSITHWGEEEATTLGEQHPFG